MNAATFVIKITYVRVKFCSYIWLVLNLGFKNMHKLVVHICSEIDVSVEIVANLPENASCRAVFLVNGVNPATEVNRCNKFKTPSLNIFLKSIPVC